MCSTNINVRIVGEYSNRFTSDFELNPLKTLNKNIK